MESFNCSAADDARFEIISTRIINHKNVSNLPEKWNNKRPRMEKFFSLSFLEFQFLVSMN